MAIVWYWNQFVVIEAHWYYTWFMPFDLDLSAFALPEIAYHIYDSIVASISKLWAIMIDIIAINIFPNLTINLISARVDIPQAH